MKSALPHDTVVGSVVASRRAPSCCRRARRCAAPAAHVGETPRGRVRARIEHRALDVEPADQAESRPATNSRAADGEGDDGRVGVGGERRDAARHLAQPLALRPLGVGHRVVGTALVRITGQRVGVGDEPLLAGGDVEHPQAVDRVVPPALRRNTTRWPSALTARLRGSPSVNRRVRAYWRGKVSLTGPFSLVGATRSDRGHGSTMILACCSGLARSRNACGTSSIDT